MNKMFLHDWYYLSTSAQIKKGKVYTFNYFSTTFVCYRDSNKSINLFNAYCPHLGAHLGVGGKILNDLLICPFHGWKYNAMGECVEIPYCEKIPKRAKLQSYQVQEVNSLVFFNFNRALNNMMIKADKADINWLKLKKVFIKECLNARMEKTELLKFIETAKTYFNFKSYGSGLFMVKSICSPVSLLVMVTPVNNKEYAVSFFASVEQNIINLFQSYFMRQEAKKYFDILLNTGVVV